MSTSRFLSCIALTGLVAACTPAPKAVEVVEASKPAPTPSREPVAEVTPVVAPLPGPAAGPKLPMPDLTRKLPEARDFQATVGTAQSVLRATPPPPNKPIAE